MVSIWGRPGHAEGGTVGDEHHALLESELNRAQQEPGETHSHSSAREDLPRSATGSGSGRSVHRRTPSSQLRGEKLPLTSSRNPNSESEGLSLGLAGLKGHHVRSRSVDASGGGGIRGSTGGASGQFRELSELPAAGLPPRGVLSGLLGSAGGGMDRSVSASSTGALEVQECEHRGTGARRHRPGKGQTALQEPSVGLCPGVTL